MQRKLSLVKIAMLASKKNDPVEISKGNYKLEIEICFITGT